MFAMKDVFRLRAPVKFVVGLPPIQEAGGQHCFDGGLHWIYVRDELPPIMASMVGWHELTHAYQVEKMGHEGMAREWTRQLAAVGLNGETLTGHMTPQELEAYRSVPLEAEAISNEDLHYLLPLTVE